MSVDPIVPVWSKDFVKDARPDEKIESLPLSIQTFLRVIEI